MRCAVCGDQPHATPHTDAELTTITATIKRAGEIGTAIAMLYLWGGSRDPKPRVVQ